MIFNSIKNYYQVTENIATSGQPTPEQFNDIAKMGYAVVINLVPTSNNALTDEGAIVTGFNMTYIHIPVVWENPQTDDVFQFFKVMDAFKNHKVWVHCAMNMRVSCFMYLYQKHILKVPEEQASYPMNEIWHPQGVWQALIQEVEKTLN